jgi:hypothetical protein
MSARWPWPHAIGCDLDEDCTCEADTLIAARERLEWLRSEYGPEDIDFVTFALIYEALFKSIEAAG